MKKKVPDMMGILSGTSKLILDMLDKSAMTTLQGSKMDHFIKMEKQLMSIIYDNK